MYGRTVVRHLFNKHIRKKREVKHVRARMIPSYYREEWWGMDTEGCQDRTGIGLFSPEIRYS